MNNQVTINGRTYDVPEMDFNAICDLEERGINLLSLESGTPKIATMIRGLAAWIMGTDQRTAAVEIQKHIEAGGSIVEIMEAVNGALSESGFFKQGQENSPKKPMDHQRASRKRTTTP